MARICIITGKKPQVGHKVSFSNKKSKKRFLPNLITKNLYIPELDAWVNIKMSTSALRTMNKKGVYQTLKDANLI
ncbi:MAG: 50S ribosomal protein L28 [Luteibaculaceae bacterium]